MRLVIVESPFKGETEADTERHTNYARAAMHDCLMRGEAPYASHLLYTQPGVLDDRRPDERSLGISAGLWWGSKADASVVYSDLGVSRGMQQGIEHAHGEGRQVVFRSLLRAPAGGPGQRYCCQCWACLDDKTAYGAGPGSGTGSDGFFRCATCHDKRLQTTPNVTSAAQSTFAYPTCGHCARTGPFLDYVSEGDSEGTRRWLCSGCDFGEKAP